MRPLLGVAFGPRRLTSGLVGRSAMARVEVACRWTRLGVGYLVPSHWAVLRVTPSIRAEQLTLSCPGEPVSNSHEPSAAVV